MRIRTCVCGGGMVLAWILAITGCGKATSTSRGPHEEPPASRTAKDYLARYKEDPNGYISAELPKQELEVVVKELRGKFPFESLAPLLAHEKRAASFEETIQLDPEEARKNFSIRLDALRRLHSDGVETFVNQEGFGNSRMIPISPQNLELPKLKPIPLEKFTYRSDQYGPTELSDEQQRAMPEQAQLNLFVKQSTELFAAPRRTGYVKSLYQVAGYMGHGMESQPQMLAPSDSSWKVRRFQLVSLLKYTSPRVYLSENLPRMSELTDGPTRALDPFERKALKRIQDNEELVVDAQLNRIRMLGVIRAQRECKICHSVKLNSVLGAFSYELLRHPPLEFKKVKAKQLPLPKDGDATDT